HSPNLRRSAARRALRKETRTGRAPQIKSNKADAAKACSCAIFSAEPHPRDRRDAPAWRARWFRAEKNRSPDASTKPANTTRPIYPGGAPAEPRRLPPALSNLREKTTSAIPNLQRGRWAVRFPYAETTTSDRSCQQTS